MTGRAPARPDAPPAGPAADGTAMAGIARGGLASLVGSGVSAVSQLVVVLLVTRWYSPSDAGALFAATAAFFIVVAVVQLGTDQGLVRFLASHRARGQEHQLRQILRIGLVPVVGAALLGSVVILALAGPLGRLFGDAGAGGGDVGQMLRVLAIAIPLAAVHETVLAASRGLGSLRSTIVVERIVRPILQPLAIIGVVAADLGPRALAPAWAAPYLVALVWSSLALRRTLHEVERSGGAAGSAAELPGLDADVTEPGRSLRAEFWSFTSGRAVSRIFQVALQRVDVLLVAALVGTGAAAVYTAATRFIAVGMLANQAIQQVIQPRLAAMLARDETAAAEHVLRRTTVWLVALVWPGYLAMAVLAPTLMSVFGDGYDGGAPALAILAVAMMLASAAGPLDVALLMAGRSAVSLLNMSVALAVDIVGCLLLLEPLGVTGAAIAWAAAIVVRNLMTIAQTKRLLGLTAGSRELAGLTVLALACFAVVPVPLALLDAPAVVIVAAVLVGALGYLVILYGRRAALGLDAAPGAAPTPAPTLAPTPT